MFPELVTTARLTLSRWSVDRHTAGLTALNAEPAAVEFLNDGVPYTADETRRQSERIADHWSVYGFGLWALEPQDAFDAPNPVIGFTGISHPRWFPELAHEVELGWRLHPRAWGHGFAT